MRKRSRTPRAKRRPPISRTIRRTTDSGRPHRRARVRWWGAFALLLATAACKATAVRPYLTPLPHAPIDTLRADPVDLIDELSALVTAEGLRVRSVSAEEGYLETGWYDVATGSPSRSYGSAVDRYVRLRFFVDPVNPLLTQLVSEAVIRRTLDPSLPERDAEVLAPPGHPANQMLARIRDALRSQHAGAAP